MGIAGASLFRNAAVLANQNGTAAQTPSLLGDVTLSLLDVGRGLNSVKGLGLSSHARELNRQYLSSTAGNYNTLFSTGVSGSGTPEGLLTQVLALRSELGYVLPEGADPSATPVRGNNVNQEV